MLCCIVLYVWGGGGEGCISDYQGCYAVLCCMFGGCISDYQGCYAVLCCMFGGCISDYQGCYAVLCCTFGGCISDYNSRMLCCVVLFVCRGGGGVYKRCYVGGGRVYASAF